MAVISIGTDLIVVERFSTALERHPGLAEKLLTEKERKLSVESMAARFAAKEALAKALGSPGGMKWQECEVVRDEFGKPEFRISGGVRARVEELGITKIHLSISHDGGFSTAMVVCE